MKKILTIIQLLFINFCFAQKTNTCYVKYQSYADPQYFFVHWFDNEKTTFCLDDNYSVIKKFTVFDGQKVNDETDTVKYNKEYHQFIDDIKARKAKKTKVVNQRLYSSNILQRSNDVDDGGKITKYFVIDTLVSMSHWSLDTATKEILGFKCQKATTTFNGINYVAFFSVELPYPAGPRNFRGLPGLILSVENETKTLGYIAIEIQKPFIGVLPKLETGGKVVTQKEYNVIINDVNKRTMENFGNLIANPSSILQKPQQ